MKGQTNFDMLNDDLPTEGPASKFILQSFIKFAKEQHNLPSNIFQLSRGKAYSSITFQSTLICRVCFRGQNQYISIANQYVSLFPPNAQIYSDPKELKFSKINIQSNQYLQEILQNLCAVLDQVINNTLKEYDCCSRYNECSDAKKCVHPDALFSLGCGYRKIINSGRIFHGQNRNID